MSHTPKLALIVLSLVFAFAAGAHAEEGRDGASSAAEVSGVSPPMPGLEEDPLDRYQRDPLPATRLGDDTEVKRGPIEPQFQDAPDYDEDAVPPVEEQQGIEVQAGAAMNSAPPPGAFSLEPNAFGPPRGTFRLPPSIGAPGVPQPAAKARPDEAARPSVSDTAGAAAAAADVAADARASVPSTPEVENAVDPFASGGEPTHEDWESAHRDARRELTLPDEYLDPTWPDDGSETRIAPEESDSVENVPLGDEDSDAAEREDAEHTKAALGVSGAGDEFNQDDWGDTSADRAQQRDVKEYEDPAEW